MEKYIVAVLTAIVIASPAFAAIIDPSEIPTNVEQCKKGGWQDYQVFKNQGDCVSYVVTNGANQPAGIQ